MRIFAVKERTPLLHEQLLEIWEKSVRATHLFLSDHAIKEIKKYIPQAIDEVAHLVVAENEDKHPVAFMGIERRTLAMLFITPEARGNGLGRRLIRYGIAHYAIQEVAVNEQNLLAKGFYAHMGFQVYKRTDHDEQGNPYPLLYMKLH
nr:GNAT family N-acetyltransferase [Maliibacterium massiliense]